VEHVAAPVPAENEVLISIHATTVNRTDAAWRQGDHPLIRLLGGLVRPRWRVLGTEFAGEIAGVGTAVRGFAVGDRVFGIRRFRRDGFGAHAEQMCLREDAAFARMPPDATFEQAAAACDGAINALTSLRRVDLRSGQRILVYGASGSIGTAAVQLARHLGADVTAVCGAAHVDAVRALGADTVLDYHEEEVTKRGESWDVIFDAVGRQSFGRCRRLLTPDGTYIATDGLANALLAVASRWVGRWRVVFPIPKYTRDNVEHMKGLIEAGTYRPVIDRVYPMEQAVEAARYVDTKHKLGNVVLVVRG
jgi:NADPH:quinone reductase-like Zn-dependent oxidoreductase